MSVNSMSLGFAGANKLLRVEYTSGPTSVRKIACFLFATSWLVAALPSHDFHPLDISTEHIMFNVELANRPK